MHQLSVSRRGAAQTSAWPKPLAHVTRANPHNANARKHVKPVSLNKIMHKSITNNTNKNKYAVANVELLPLCSPRFGVGKPPAEARVLGAWLNELLSGGRQQSEGLGGARTPLVDSESLLLAHLQPAAVPLTGDALGTADDADAVAAVERAEREPLLAWYLSVDMYCLDYGGNVADAALLALLAALRDVRLPQVRRRGPGDYVRAHKRTEPVKLLFTPIPASFAIIGDAVVADPNEAEEDVADATFTIVLDGERFVDFLPFFFFKKKCNPFLLMSLRLNIASGKMRSIHKPGGAVLSLDSLRTCLASARERISSVLLTLQNALSASRLD